MRAVFCGLLITGLVGSGLVAGCDNSDLDARIKKLEDQNKKYQESWDALKSEYDRQKQQAGQQREQREREEPAEDAMFAVDIADDLKGNQVEGPASAGVTIVEAWDFA
jgi:hypothetical protein